MVEQEAAGQAASHPDRLIKWFVSVVLVGVGVNVLSAFVLAHKWSWLPPVIFVATIMVAVPRAGLLRRERHGATRWARYLAWLALIAYLAVAVWGWVAGWSVVAVIVPVAFLWGAGVVLLWSTLRSRASFTDVAVGTASLLAGSVFLLWGIALLVYASIRSLTGVLLTGAALALGGVIGLLAGVPALLHKWRWTLTVTCLIGFVALLLGGAESLLRGWVLFGVGCVLVAAACLLWGAVFRWHSSLLVLAVVALVLVGFLLWGIDALLSGYTLFGIAFLGIDLAILMVLIGAGSARSKLVGVASLLLGIALVLDGVPFLLREWTLAGVAPAFLGVAFVILGAKRLYSRELGWRAVEWLTQRDDAAEPPTAERGPKGAPVLDPSRERCAQPGCNGAILNDGYCDVCGSPRPVRFFSAAPSGERCAQPGCTGAILNDGYCDVCGSPSPVRSTPGASTAGTDARTRGMIVQSG